jgi:hypothetical protein
MDFWLAALHIDPSNMKRSRFVIRILTPFEAMRPYALPSKETD